MNNVSPHTRFYRDPAQLEALAGVLNKPRVRLLSAGCSSGEEVYTLAMMFPNAEVVGIDIDAANIETARRGVYANAELPAKLKKYLHNDSIDEAVSARCRFVQADLLKTGLFGPFDGILCRNVVIYLAESDALTLLERLGRALSPDGVLLVARAELQLARRVLTAFDLADDVVAFRR